MFRRTILGYVPWFLQADETVFLTMGLWYAIDLVQEISSGEFAANSTSGPGSAPTWVFPNGKWLDQWEPIPEPQAPEPIPDYPDLGRLQRSIQGTTMGESPFELGIFYIEGPVQERKGERPCFPETTLAVDPNSGLALALEVNGPAPSAVDRQDTIVHILEKFDELPTGKIVDSDSSANVVETITRHLGIELSAGPTPALEAMEEELWVP